MSSTAIIVQARTSSRRMPEKVLAPLAGEPALARMMERVARVRHPHRALVATSVDSSDDAIEQLCRERGIECVRGSLDDVLGRFIHAMPEGTDVVVRLTGDCPLIDPHLIDEAIALFQGNDVDYVSNAVVRTQPDGLDVEVMSAALLLEAHGAATRQHDREHVTPWVQRRARQLPLAQDIDLSALRWTLDTPDDYRSIAAIYERLHPRNPRFETRHVYQLLVEEPGLIHLAAGEPALYRERIQNHLAATATP